MKNILVLTTLSFLILHTVWGQTEITKKKFWELHPAVFLGIWDFNNSEQSITIDSLGYDEIPKYLDYKGTVVEALRWKDSQGENILVQTVTGYFDWKDYNEDSSSYSVEGKSELLAYLFQRKEEQANFILIWKVYDFKECFGVDWYTGFIPRATTITDVDMDGVSEISMPYVLICRGGMDPGTMKIVMYEGDIKYVLRGSTMPICEGEVPYGGEFEASENLKNHNTLNQFLLKRWEAHKCENQRFY